MATHSIWRPPSKFKVLNLLGYPTPLSEFDLDSPDRNLVVACPDAPAEAVAAGLAIDINPLNADAREIRGRMPPGFTPDMIHLSARDIRFLPKNLRAFGCPTVMKLGDTFQWGDGSLLEIIEYCRQLDCDYHWTYQCPQHLHFFVEAGLRNVFWLPGTVALEFAQVPPVPRKDGKIVFRGSLQSVHGRRAKLLRSLEAAGFPVDSGRTDYRGALRDYAGAGIAFNCSANGDLNRRVFEVVMAGGFLLTDRLSSDAGLGSLFVEGKHYEGYGDEGELARHSKYYLANPDRAREIGLAGQTLLMDAYPPEKMREDFYSYVIDGISARSVRKAETRAPSEDRECLGLRERVAAYEILQEIHANLGEVKGLIYGDIRSILASDLRDLVRLTIVDDSPAGKIDFALVNRSDAVPFVEQAVDALPKLKDTGLVMIVGDGPVPAQVVAVMRRFGLRKMYLAEGVSGRAMGHGLVTVFASPGAVQALKLRPFNRFARLKRFGRRLLGGRR